MLLPQLKFFGGVVLWALLLASIDSGSASAAPPLGWTGGSKEYEASADTSEKHDGKASGTKYKAWYRSNLAAKYPRLTETDVYSLRCGVVHQGRFGHTGMQYDRIIFVIPDTTAGVTVFAHNSPFSWPDITFLALDAVTFCNDFVAAARAWFTANERHPAVRANIERLVRFRPEGLPPRILDMPMIA
jgi:hypothetical protein